MTPIDVALDQCDPDWAAFLIVERQHEVVGVVARERLLAQLTADAVSGGAAHDRLLPPSELSRAVAHDCNNLLTVLLGRLSLMSQRQPNGSEERADVDEICDVALRATALVKKLLPGAGGEVTALASLDLPSALGQLEPILVHLLGENIAFTLDISDDVSPVDADSTSIERIVTNLVINARHAMPHGGRLTLAARNAPDRCVCISVSDTGVGMSPELLERAFEPYFTTRRGAGTGLGLATVRGIAAKLGGRVSVESAPSCGTRFDILLPASESDPAHERAARAQRTAPTRRVLVVDDDALVAAAAVRLLESMGHVATAIGSIDAAKAELDAGEAIDIVVSDWLLGGGNGSDLIAWLRATHPRVRTVLTSGHSLDLGAPGLNADAVLPKPFTPAQLQRAIAAAFAAER